MEAEEQASGFLEIGAIFPIGDAPGTNLLRPGDYFRIARIGPRFVASVAVALEGDEGDFLGAESITGARIELLSSGGDGNLSFGLFRGEELRSLENDPPPTHIQTTEKVDDDVLHLSGR